jgi:hypothetical protein
MAFASGTVDFFLSSTNLSSNINKLLTTTPGVSNDVTTAAFGTNTTSRYFRFIPTTAAGTDMGAGTPPFAFANVGWKVLSTDMNSLTNATRFIAAGDWVMTFDIWGTTAQVTSDSVLAVEVWRVASGGATATRIFSASSAAFAAGITAAPKVVTITKTAVARVDFAVGETLMIEVYLQSLGIAVTGQTLTCRLEAATGATTGQSAETHSGQALQTVFSQSTSDAAPSADGTTRVALFPRALADTAAASDAAIRSYHGVRGLSDSAVATDVLTRVASFPRATSDAAPSSDVTTRIALFNRALADLAPAVDTVTRHFVVSRQLADSALAADAITRIATYVRATADNLASSAVTVKKMLTIFDD